MFYIEFFIYYLAAINIIAFITYGIDKLMAIRQWRRISEFTLLLLAFVGGSVGALVGIVLWHHKTSHLKFSIGVPAILLAQLALLVYVYIRY